MNEETKKMYAFGYGVPLLIAFFMIFGILHRDFGYSNFWVLILSFGLMLLVISKTAQLKPIYNLWIFVVLGLILGFKLKMGISVVFIVFWLCAFLILLATLKDVVLLKPIYEKWMKIAHLIGTVISGAILCVVFYCVFTPVGILLRILQRDLLHRKIEKDKSSYWIDKEAEVFDRKRYQQQF